MPLRKPSNEVFRIICIIFCIIITEDDIKALRIAITCHRILIRVPQRRRFKIWTNVLDAFL